MHQENIKQKKAHETTPISDKVDLKTRGITSIKDKRYI